MPIGFGSSTLGSRKLMTSGIIQDKHLMLWYDYQYPQCYPKSGTAITNLAPGRTALHSSTLSTVGYNQAQNAASLVFNGVDSAMDISNTSSGEWETNQEITVESWVKTSSYLSVDGDVSQFIFQRGSTGVRWDLQSVNISGGTIGAYRFRTAGGNGAVLSSTNLVTNKWYHVAVTRTLTKVNLATSPAIGMYGRGFQNKATGLGSDLFHCANNSGQRITTFSNNTFQKESYTAYIISSTTGLTASTTPDIGTNDDGYWALSLPFIWNFMGSIVATVYIGTNGYITFSPDGGVTTFTENGINDLRMPRINLFAADNSCQRIYYGTVGTTPTRVFRVIWEGTETTAGTLGAPTIIYQIDFREDMTSTFDLKVSSNARIDPRYDLYLNGSLDASNYVQSSLSYRLPIDSVDTRIGNYLGANSFTYNGEIAIQRIYNRALTSEEILSNYNAEKTRFGYT